MKLRLLFIVMDLLTIVAYPILYLYSRLRQFSKPKENITNSLLVGVSFMEK